MDRPCHAHVGNPKFITGMSTKRITGHQLLGNRLCQRAFQTALDIDVGQLPGFSGGILTQLLTFTRDIRLLGIGLKLTDTYSPDAMDIAPATSPATPAISTL